MALNLKNSDVERLAAEVATITGETKTEAIRKALEERRERLSYRIADTDRASVLATLLEVEVWPLIPRGLLGRALTRKERADILGAAT